MFRFALLVALLAGATALRLKQVPGIDGGAKQKQNLHRTSPIELEKVDADADEEGKPQDSKPCPQAQATPIFTEHAKGSQLKGRSHTALKPGSYYHTALQQHKDADFGCSAESKNCKPPVWVQAHQDAKDQKIPRIIWMTMKSSEETGPFQYKSMSDHWINNPEYEFILSDDAMSDGFMASSEVPQKWKDSYNKAKPGAMRADIWRYAVMHVYGGVYMDQDMTAQKALADFVPAEATVFQAITPKGPGRCEATQFALFSVPNHPIWGKTMDVVESNLVTKPKDIALHVTGPSALATAYIDLYSAEGCPALKACGKGHTGICSEFKGCQNENIGNIMVSAATRDLGTGIKWHKVDGCALAEVREEGYKHW